MSSVPKTILIVEDDPDSREMFIELLRGGGYFVFAAANGKAGIAKRRRGFSARVLSTCCMRRLRRWRAARFHSGAGNGHSSTATVRF